MRPRNEHTRDPISIWKYIKNCWNVDSEDRSTVAKPVTHMDETHRNRQSTYLMWYSVLQA